jgi:hypothetical protein
MTHQADDLEELAQRVRAVESRLGDYQQRDLEAQLGWGTPARFGSGLGALSPLGLGAGPIVPAAVLASGAVTADSIAVGAVNNLTNVGATVIIDAAGITVTNGALVVTNPGSTVIIDGTSDMFRIEATGTLSVTGPATTRDTSTDLTLTGLGALPTTPAHIDYIAGSNVTSVEQILAVGQQRQGGFVATTSGGSPTLLAEAATVQARITTHLDADALCVVHFVIDNDSAAPVTWYGRYYVLSQAAL